jgi:hypothetical protein
VSLTELIQKIHELSPEEQEVIRRELDQVQLSDGEETPETLAVIDEGLRSSREEPSCTIEDLREDMRKWNSGSR